MIGIDGYHWSLCGTKVQQSMQCATLLIACALFSPISAFGSDFSLSANPTSCSLGQSLRLRGGTLRKAEVQAWADYLDSLRAGNVAP